MTGHEFKEINNFKSDFEKESFEARININKKLAESEKQMKLIREDRDNFKSKILGSYYNHDTNIHKT